MVTVTPCKCSFEQTVVERYKSCMDRYLVTCDITFNSLRSVLTSTHVLAYSAVPTQSCVGLYHYSNMNKPFILPTGAFGESIYYITSSVTHS